jgi:hypothetical protein
MRKTILRNAVLLAAFVLAVSVMLTAMAAGWSEAMSQLAWPIALSVGVGAFSAWQSADKLRKATAGALPRDFHLVPVVAQEWPDANWQALDDHAMLLEAKGYKRLGDFTTSAPSTVTRGFARFLADPEGKRLVEIQHFERLAPTPTMGDEQFRIRFSMTSMVGGRIRVMVTDRPVHPAFYSVRGDHDVVASYPDTPLLELIAQHERLANYVAGRIGKEVDLGLTIERYVVLERERFAAVRQRLQRASGWAFLGEWDRFAETSPSNWAPEEAHMRGLPSRSLDELEDSLPAPSHSPSTAATGVDTALRERMVSGAHWFYWIAALSAVNAVSAAMGSKWGFIIGLGATQVVSAVGSAGTNPEAEATMRWVGLAVNLVIIGVFLLFGWLATRPSILAFSIGIGLFALDALIFVLVADWLGLAFHGLALYFLWGGLQAARRMKSVAVPVAS